MTGQTDDALVLMERAVASRDPLELALAGFLSAYKGRTFDKQRRVIKHYVDWCLRNDLPPLEAKRPHIELFGRDRPALRQLPDRCPRCGLAWVLRRALSHSRTP